MTANGYNPMRWNCAEQGCFNVFQRPKIEVFAECLPGMIAMSDVDATVEVNGHFLFFEFKTSPRRIPTGQRIYFERLTRLSDKITVIIIYADPQTMDCYEFCSVDQGRVSGWDQCTLEQVKSRLRDWVKWTQIPRPLL